LLASACVHTNLSWKLQVWSPNFDVWNANCKVWISKSEVWSMKIPLDNYISWFKGIRQWYVTVYPFIFSRYNPKFPWKLYKEEINENIRLGKLSSVLLLQVHINTMPLLLLVILSDIL
jgi:hypothetical protein